MGRYTLPLAARGIVVEGIDLSQTLLDRLREFNSGGPEIRLHLGDIVDLPERIDRPFDAVVGFFTLHHLHDLRTSFGAMARLVRPGGRIIFLEPNLSTCSTTSSLSLLPG